MSPQIKIKPISYSLCLFLCLALIGSPITTRASNPSLELVLIPIGNDLELKALVDLGLPVFESVTTSKDTLLVFLPVSPQQKDLLGETGFTPQVLGSYDSLAEAQPHLLYGAPADLEKVSQIMTLLWYQDRFALVMTSPQLANQLSSHGIQRKALHLKPLSIPEEKVTSPLDFSSLSAITPSPLVQGMLAQVSQSALFSSVGDFSGEHAVTINGSPYTLLTRYTFAYTPITKATRLAYEKFLEMGLTSWYDYYFIGDDEYRNVLAQQYGITQPERVLMLTAHLDSISPTPYTFAPGADDNASGSVALLAIAKILSQYQFGCTLRYALFTGEEQGMYGSEAYASNPDPGNIQAVLNLDMLGYNTPDSAPAIELHTRPSNANDLAIAYLFRDSVSAYQLQLNPQIVQDGLSFSDHASFWSEGYPALLAIEDWDDHTPNYHLTSDQLENMNMPYYTQFTKAALATFAHMGCLIEAGLTGAVRDSSSAAPVAGAQVVARLDAQQAWSTTSLADGSYRLNLQPGTYTVETSATGYVTRTIENVLVGSGQLTNLNIELQACSAVQSVDFTISNAFPQLAETVLFSGAAQGTLPITYSWTFGDGATASGQTVQHAFSEKGIFSVSMTASNLCSSTAVNKFISVEMIPLYLPLIIR